MNNYIDKELIEDRINNFLGYGNLKGNVWFIGMEEGSSNQFDELKNRFQISKNDEVLDIRNLEGIIENVKWFDEKKRVIQPTWNKLIQIILMLKGEDHSSLNRRKDFQIKELGSKSSDHCLLELSSLPSKSTKTWVYNKYCSNISYLESRKAYIREIIPQRIDLFANKIKEYKPKLVICYSKTYKDYWNKIKDEIHLEDTKLLIIPHPIARTVVKGKVQFKWDDIYEEIKKAYFNEVITLDK